MTQLLGILGLKPISNEVAIVARLASLTHEAPIKVRNIILIWVELCTTEIDVNVVDALLIQGGLLLFLNPTRRSFRQRKTYGTSLCTR